MIKASKNDEPIIIDILTEAFISNKSVNYIIKQDNCAKDRISALMSYSFNYCMKFGDVFLSPEKDACALIIYPDKKRTSIQSIWLDVKLIFKTTGLANVKKTVAREKAILRSHPKELKFYLWFIGVHPSKQGNGTGSRFLNELIQLSLTQGRTFCLETSTEKNLPWYQKHGFKIYNKLDFGFTLYCLKI